MLPAKLELALEERAEHHHRTRGSFSAKARFVGLGAEAARHPANTLANAQPFA